MRDPFKALVRVLVAAVPLACGPADDRELTAVEARSDPLNPAIWIPGGAFVSGSDDWNAGYPIASPYSKVDEDPRDWTVEGFWIQQHEVTNQEYARFDPDHQYVPEEGLRPVTGVTWSEAMAYARSLGGTLPSEVHWEFASRGAGRRLYPWGDAEPTCALAHYVDCEPASSLDVRARPGDVTPEGVHDLAGNVREWVAPVWFVPGRHPVNREARRMKGGSFAHPAFFLRSASVTNGFRRNEQWEYVGFRVAWGTTHPTPS